VTEPITRGGLSRSWRPEDRLTIDTINHPINAAEPKV